MEYLMGIGLMIIVFGWIGRCSGGIFWLIWRPTASTLLCYFLMIFRCAHFLDSAMLLILPGMPSRTAHRPTSTLSSPLSSATPCRVAGIGTINDSNWPAAAGSSRYSCRSRPAWASSWSHSSCSTGRLWWWDAPQISQTHPSLSWCPHCAEAGSENWGSRLVFRRGSSMRVISWIFIRVRFGLPAPWWTMTFILVNSATYYRMDSRWK